MEACRDGSHDKRLYLRPVVDDLPVTHPDDVIATQTQFGVVPIVTVPLCANMGPAIDLENEPVADEQIDTVAGDPDLRTQREPEPPQPHDGDRLEP